MKKAAGRRAITASEEETGRIQRREILRLMAEHGLTVAALARKAGLGRPNVLYNFFNGHTKQLSVPTLMKVAKALQVSVDDLMGSLPVSQPSTPRPIHKLIVRASVGASNWRQAFDLPLEQQFRSPLDVERDLHARGAYGVIVTGKGAEKIYACGTILVVVPLDRWDGTLVPGRRVVLQRIREQVEVTVREIEVRDGYAWLWPRSTEPEPACQVPVSMPWPSATAMWRRGDDNFLIASVVVKALVPEE